MNTRAASVTVVVLPLLVGCSSIASHIAEEATPKVVDSGLESASSEPNKAKIRELIDETAVKTSVIEVNGEVVDTILERLAHPKNEQHLRTLTAHVFSSATRALEAPSPGDDQKSKEAALERVARMTVRAAMEELKRSLPALISEVFKDPSVRKAIQPLSRSAGAGAARGVTDKLTGGDSIGNGD